MKKLVLFFAMAIAMGSFIMAGPTPVEAQDAGPMAITSATICKNVINREPVDAGTSFLASEAKLYCFSKIDGIQSDSEIVHAWYYGGVERTRITLGVKPPAWRTYSSKIIQPHEIGAWRVEILDSAGNILKTVEFEITR
jgi:hypothetical protein